MRRLFAPLLAALMLVLPLAGQAAEPAAPTAPGTPFVEGTDYVPVRTVKDTTAVQGVLVEEVFGYWCPHCNEFDPSLSAWLARQPKDVVFERVPVTFGRAEARVLSQAYYTALQLKVLNKTHTALFAALHQQRKRITTPEAMAELFTNAAGVMPDLTLSILKSFPVDRQVGAADKLATSYGVTGVPTLVIDGRYMISASRTQNFERMLACADFLIAKARAEKAR